MLWLLLFLLLASVVAITVAPFLRAPRQGDDTSHQARVYRRQLDDIDREEHLQIISQEEANALRLEAQRRLLAVNKNAEPENAPMEKPHIIIALGAAGMVVAGAATLYAIKGSPEISSSPTRAAAPIIATTTQSADGSQQVGSVDSMVAQLAARLEANPDDAEGWRMLGWSYFNLDKYADAAKAYEKAVALAPDNASYQTAHGEALVMAAGGFVTEQAQDVFAKTLSIDPGEPRAGFFLGLAKDQAGDAQGAIDDWTTLLKSAPAGADWAPDLRKRIIERAAEAGVDVSDAIPEATVALSTPAPRPSVQDVQAAMEMPANDRQAMIEDMVSNLAARLAENPNDPDGWVRLMRSHMVLGRPEAARTDLAAALAAFADAPQTRERIRAEASALGVTAN